MATGLIDAVIAELERVKSPLGLNLVSGAADFQRAVESNPAATPAAYVFPLDESASPSPVTPDIHQRVAVNLAVVLVVRNLGDAKGAGAATDMETLRQAVKAVLLGFCPGAGFYPLERGRSHLLAFRDGYMWWQDAYATVYHDRSQL